MSDTLYYAFQRPTVPGDAFYLHQFRSVKVWRAYLAEYGPVLRPVDASGAARYFEKLPGKHEVVRLTAAQAREWSK